MDYYTCPDCHGTGKVRWGRVKVECDNCDGTGLIPYVNCFQCGGSGEAQCICTKGGTQAAEKDCTVCHGTGVRPCPRCRGTGRLRRRRRNPDDGQA